ncbi:hypothetical protein [Vibrio mediterranei]|uniref:hypothetical protein n=1 Tax=Vibrio mediterranei TaxID=689 RepID=UPI00209C13F3|nr:hypothetical protein [Vibrio mediterranei]
MNTKTQQVLERLERLGNDNDRLQSERAKKYLNITKIPVSFSLCWLKPRTHSVS